MFGKRKIRDLSGNRTLLATSILPEGGRNGKRIPYIRNKKSNDMKKLILGLALAGMMMPAGLWAQESAAQAARTEENPLWLRYPAISPDGTQIAFCYMGDIFIVPVSGGEARQLTSNPAYDYMPVWSPDGSKIVFSSDREGSLDLYYVGVKGGNPVRLTTNSGTETPLAFTLDGQSVLFKSGLMPTVNSMLFPV